VQFQPVYRREIQRFCAAEAPCRPGSLLRAVVPPGPGVPATPADFFQQSDSARGHQEIPLSETVRWLLHGRSEEHTSELQSREDLVCRLLLEKKTEQVILYDEPNAASC